MKNPIKRSYNVRIYEHEDGTFSLGWVSAFRPNRKTPKNPKGEGGTWVNASAKRLGKRLNIPVSP